MTGPWDILLCPGQLRMLSLINSPGGLVRYFCWYSPIDQSDILDKHIHVIMNTIQSIQTPCRLLSILHPMFKGKIVDHSFVVCQSLHVAVKRELISSSHKERQYKRQQWCHQWTEKCTSSPDSNSSSKAASLLASIPHSTSDYDDKQVLSDPTSAIPLCIPPKIPTESISPLPYTPLNR